jgi:phosphoglycerate kinase
MKTLNDFNIKDKLVLLRSDINSDVKGKTVLMSERIKEAATTINFLKKQKAKVVVISHQGNPGKKDFLSLKQHTKLLNKFTKINFVEDVAGKKAIEEIKKLKSGEAILLENLRFLKEEKDTKKKTNLIIKNLAPLFDLYINDAFSVCHREQTSITLLPKYIKNSCAGPLVKKELDALEKISMKNSLYLLGGAKPESNIKLLGKNKVLAGGLFGQMCLIAKGKDLGYQNEFLKKNTLTKGEYNNFLNELKKKQKNVLTPVDFAVNINGKRKEYSVKDFPLEFQIDDIGKETTEKYVKEIKRAKSIYMKGPFGFTQDKTFSKGTVTILKAIAESKGFSLIGGGHLSDTIEKYKLPKKKFNHISLSGGALLNYVAGKELPGLKALGYYAK